jgi:hypothetical protein
MEARAHKKENRPIKQAKENSEGWFITPEGYQIPEKAAAGLVRLTHGITQLGKTPYKDCYKNTWLFPK